MSCRDDLHEVLVSVVILGKEDKVIIPAVGFVFQLVVEFGDIDLASDNRLYRWMLCREFEKLLDAVHVAMVRDGKTRHPELICTVEQILNRRLSIEYGIVRMYV